MIFHSMQATGKLPQNEQSILCDDVLQYILLRWPPPRLGMFTASPLGHLMWERLQQGHVLPTMTGYINLNWTTNQDLKVPDFRIFSLGVP